MTAREIKLRRRYLAEENKKYPVEMLPVDRMHWPPDSVRQAVIGVWRSRDYLAALWKPYPCPPGVFGRLSINRTQMNDKGDWVDGIKWDDLQRIKAECGFGSMAAVEVYPPDVDVVNVANIRHLWILTEIPAFTWRD